MEPFCFVVKKEPIRALSPNKIININYSGSTTLSIAWITPFEVSTSAITTFALLPCVSFTYTLPSHNFRVSSLPCKVLTVNCPPLSFIAFTTSPAINCPATTWYFRIDCKVDLFSGFKSVPRVPSGNLLKPSLVGAKTVNGPSDESASTNSPACTAATKVEKLSFETAVSTIFLSLTLDDNTDLKSNI